MHRSSMLVAHTRRGARSAIVTGLVVGIVAALLVAAGPVAAAGGAERRASARPAARLWSALEAIPAAPATAGGDAARSYVRPTRYQAYTLDRGGMRARLAQAPFEFTSAAGTNPLVISLPAPRGGFERFTIQEAPVVAPRLAAKFPFIKTYSGRGIDDPAATIRLDLGRTGFHAQVLSPGGDWYIDPYYHRNQSVYVSYFGKNLPNVHGSFVEHGLMDGHAAPLRLPTDAERSVGSEIRTYRLALAADGEYSQFHGGTVPLVHNELVVVTNRMTGVYERELSIRFQLVANNDSLIYLNAATDPYTNTNPSALLNQNQSNLDSVIGNANYDIGHVLTTGGGGLAGLAVVGRAGQKARGETGLASPVGDAFYIDYVAHEMGHQFGGNHSFNGTLGSCGGNANTSTAMEPGSGSSIMAYAGICAADDIQLHSDDYFHAISFDEIAAYTTTPGSPGNLGAAPSGNSVPTVSVTGGPFSIPLRTPFALSATGSDANPGDALTFGWEQYDGGALRTLTNASKPTGVLFRSFAPVSSGTRVFPKLPSILANTTNANTGTCSALPAGLDCWAEFLPTVGRTMNFRVTVRDNHVGAGGVNSANVLVTSVAGTGPFLVTSPNTAVTLPGGSAQTVTWNVAGTSAAPISTANVNILLSTDGGNTFPTTLAANTANDGSQSVTLPNLDTTQARVKVEAVGNVFFDVSDANFTIGAGGGNTPPTANADAATTPMDTPVPISVLANDTDSDGTVDPTSVVVTSGPAHGGTSVNPTTGVVTYTPTAGYSGPDSFTYTVEDDDGAVSAPATVSITVQGGGGGTTDVFPSSVTPEAGSITGGSASSLGADDNGFLVVRSNKATPKVATWFGSFTGIDNATSTLVATYSGLSSATCTQVISIWRWTDSTWVQLDSRSIGATEVLIGNLTPSGSLGDFVSGTSGPGEVRVRVSCSGSATFNLSGDLLQIQT
ncbi:MAG TPA: zinc-dependent metalloprotease family protein [Actinomycetota bacterium]